MVMNLLPSFPGYGEGASIHECVVFALGCLLSTEVARRNMKAGNFKTLDDRLRRTLAYWMTTTTPSSTSKDPSKTTKPIYPVNKDPNLTWREDGGLSKLVPVHPTCAQDTKKLKHYTMKEVAKRNSRAEAWIVIDDRVYDITNFAAKHPGGDIVLWNMAGKDCTDVFANYHSARIYKTWLPPYLVGYVTDAPKYPHAEDFRYIRQELLRRGLFETSKSYYNKNYAWIAFLFCSSLYLSLACETTAAHMMGALLMGFFWQQIAGWGHDIGHSSISHDFSYDNWIGSSVGTSLKGISVGWWKHSHNVHHVVCNSIENDPDIQHMPMFAVTDEILKQPFWSSYHSKVIQYDAPARFFIRHQHLLFPIVMAFARFNLYAQSWILVLWKAHNADSVVMHYRGTEIASLLFFATWVSAVVLSMPTWTESLAWLLLSHGFTALLHVQICLSHFSMPTYHGNAYNDASDEWYTMQLKTTLNVDCPEWFDFFHIGLQFQTEHHLYPTLPRHNLREARKMVKEVCRKHKIPYHEVTFLEGVRRTYVGLRETAMKARSGIYDEQSTDMIKDLLNAHG